MIPNNTALIWFQWMIRLRASSFGTWHYCLDNGTWHGGIHQMCDRTHVMQLPGVLIAACPFRQALCVAYARNNGYDVFFQHSSYQPTMFRIEVQS